VPAQAFTGDLIVLRRMARVRKGTVVAMFTDRVFGSDTSIYLSCAVVPAIMTPIAALLFRSVTLSLLPPQWSHNPSRLL
jgi:hypothetical protein